MNSDAVSLLESDQLFRRPPNRYVLKRIINSVGPQGCLGIRKDNFVRQLEDD